MALDGFYDLQPHVGHKIKCLQYGDDNVVLECRTCDITLVDFDRDDDDTVDYIKRGRFETRPLYATLDENNMIEDIFSEESSAIAAPEDNYIQGYGVFDIETDSKPDTAQDFHSSFETAREELERFARAEAAGYDPDDDDSDDEEDSEDELSNIGLMIPDARPGILGVIVTNNDDDDDDDDN